MSIEESLNGLEKKIRWMAEVREKEEQTYGDFLTQADQECNFPLPHELSEKLNEIKDVLNRSYDIALSAFSIAQKEERLFWKDVAQNLVEYLRPLVGHQREFNGALVHLLNEFVSSVTESMTQIRTFHNTLIRYFQRIIPLMDARMRELTAIHEKLRDYSDLLYQELDKRIETLKVDFVELQQLLGSTYIEHDFMPATAIPPPVPASPSSPKTGGEKPLQYHYYHFEEAFRGDRQDVKHRMGHYLQFFQNKVDGLVVDLGCGRGEFLELLKERSIRATGVDSNPQMIRKCRAAGLEVFEGDMLKFLELQPENSLGGIFCSQAVEHVPPDYLMRLLAAAHSRLKTGGPVILETINIGSAFSFLQMYTRDVTHRTPLHPDTLKFLVAATGFQNVQLIYVSPMPESAKLRLLEDASDHEKVLFNENMSKLNQLLFDYQDYAVLAYK